MWILQGSGQDQDLPIFRVKDGGIKTVGRAPRADFIVDRALVSRLHCRLGQGFYFARPLEAAAVDSLLSTAPDVCLQPPEVVSAR